MPCDHHAYKVLDNGERLCFLCNEKFTSSDEEEDDDDEV